MAPLGLGPGAGAHPGEAVAVAVTGALPGEALGGSWAGTCSLPEFWSMCGQRRLKAAIGEGIDHIPYGFIPEFYLCSHPEAAPRVNRRP